MESRGKKLRLDVEEKTDLEINPFLAATGKDWPANQKKEREQGHKPPHRAWKSIGTCQKRIHSGKKKEGEGRLKKLGGEVSAQKTKRIGKSGMIQHRLLKGGPREA